MKTVLLDFAGVVCTEPNIKQNILYRMFPRMLEAQVDKAFRELKFDRITESQFWEMLETDQEAGRETILKNLRIDPHLRELMGYLKRKNYLVVLFSELPQTWLDMVISHNNLRGIFDNIMSTSRLGYTKTSPGLFEEAKRRFGNCVIVDDQLEVLKAAERSGITTVWKKTTMEQTSYDPDHVIRSLEELKGIL